MFVLLFWWWHRIFLIHSDYLMITYNPEFNKRNKKSGLFYCNLRTKVYLIATHLPPDSKWVTIKAVNLSYKVRGVSQGCQQRCQVGLHFRSVLPYFLVNGCLILYFSSYSSILKVLTLFLCNSFNHVQSSDSSIHSRKSNWKLDFL